MPTVIIMMYMFLRLFNIFPIGGNLKPHLAPYLSQL